MTSTMNILIVDDDLVSRSKLEAILEDLGHCDLEPSGDKGLAAALEAAASGRPYDLVCLDVEMPNMNGYEVCRRLKADPETRTIPVVFITSQKDETNEAAGFELGAVDYIAKPFSPRVVQARIRTHLELKRHQEYLEDVIADRTRELRSAHFEILNRLAQAAEFRDNETGRHVKRLSHYCRIVGRGLELPEEHLDALFHASALHDVGKIGIPDHILLKPGRLTDAEFQIMQTHTRIGAQLLDSHDSKLLQMARVIALTHHEKWDGSGYPRGLAGTRIPLEGRITAICDVFDALTSKRVYKKAWTVDEAVEQLKKDAGRHFDPELVEAFLDHLDPCLQIVETYGDE
ncbi:MAG: response regulator [Proteobacteria bacterium]|nr:response regulator [Pseudomonadota bacterium]